LPPALALVGAGGARDVRNLLAALRPRELRALLALQEADGKRGLELRAPDKVLIIV
jgi:hypothetical protein